MVESSTPETAAPSAEPAGVKKVEARHRMALLLILLFHAALACWMAFPRGPYDIYFYDENYNMENVVRLVETHRLEPANGWYSLLSYLPQGLVAVAMDEVHQRTGHPWMQVIDPEAKAPRVATYNVFIASRLLGIAYGCVSLFLIFWLGRRLFSPAAGVLAALATAVSPWQIRSSVEFKPDSLLLASTLLVIVLLVRFLEQPSLGRLLWAGAGLGFTASVKLNGGFIGPVVVLAGIAGAIVAEPRGGRPALRRVLVWVGASMATAAAVFFATTPYLGMRLAYFDRLEKFYAQKGGSTTPHDVLQQMLADLPGPNFVGPLIWAMAIVGALLVVGRLFERGVPWSLRLSRFLLVAFPLIYGALIVLTLRYYKQNHLVQMPPSLALLAAAGLSTVAGLTDRWPRWLGRSMVFLATALFVAHSAWLAIRFSYQENVPYDWQVLNRRLSVAAPLDPPKVVIYEGSFETIPSFKVPREDGSASMPSVRWLDDLGQVGREALDLADVVVLREDIGGPQRTALIAALAGAVAPEALDPIDPHPLKIRGHGFLVVHHHWRQREDGGAPLACRNTEDQEVFHCRLPADFVPGEVASLHFGFWSKKGVGVAEILIGGEDGYEVEALASADLGRGRGWAAMSERFVVPGPGAPVLLRFEMPIEGPLDAVVPVTLSRWLPPENVKLDLPWPFKGGRKPPRPPASELPAAEPVTSPPPVEPPPVEPPPVEPPPPPVEPPPVEPPLADAVPDPAPADALPDPPGGGGGKGRQR